MMGMKRPSGEGAGLFPRGWGTTYFYPSFTQQGARVREGSLCLHRRCERGSRCRAACRRCFRNP